MQKRSTSPPRFLRNRRLRAALYYSADCCCQSCGIDLPNNWHADHVVRWHESRDTNVHEMQALCPTCHYAKTAKENEMKPFQPRKHQTELKKIAESMVFAQRIDKPIQIIATPGSGKSLLPIILASYLRQANLIDKICWVVPFDNLKLQAERQFLDPAPRKWLKHNLRVMAADGNVCDPSRGTDGYVTTYKAITSNPDLHAAEFRRARYILVLDEAHHVSVGSKSEEALQDVIDNATCVLRMSGTPGQRTEISGLAYQEVPGGKQLCLVGDHPEAHLIHYSRRDALIEKAILPLHFVLGDGQAQWVDTQGNTVTHESFEDVTAKDQSGLLDTILRTDYAYALIDKGLDDYHSHRKINAFAQMIVAAPNVQVAQQYLQYIQSRTSLKACIAVSHDGDGNTIQKEARANIQAFKQLNINILVTVGMAYEGLDAPEASHLIVLTRFRSPSWIEQLLARVVRQSKRTSKKTRGIVICPADPAMQAIIKQIQTEQQTFLPNDQSDETQAIDHKSFTKDSSRLVIPLFSSHCRSKALSLDLDPATVDYLEMQFIEEVLQDHPNMPITAVECYQLLTSIGVDIAGIAAQRPELANPEIALSPSEERKQVAQTVNILAKRVASKYFAEEQPLDEAIPTVNRLIKKHFDKSRTDMTTDELKQVFTWLIDKFPLN